MKYNKIYLASALAVALSAAVSCDDYNDQFNLDDTITDVRNTTITLTTSDYQSIASNSANKELAAQLDAEAGGGTAYADALAAVGTNGYFSTLAAAEDYVPAFLASSDNYRLADVGSRLIVNVDHYKDPSGYLEEFEDVNISSYDLTADDYESVWGDVAQATYLTPATLSQIPGLLRSAVSNAADGDMAVVNYAYSELEPSTGGNTGGDEPAYTPIADVIANTAGGEYTVSGTVVGTYARGFMLQDETAAILVYLYATPNYSVGDIVEVTGTTSQYGGLMQFPSSSTVTLLGRQESFSYPTPTAFDGGDLDDYVANVSGVEYVSYTGTLSISGNYYNITIADASTAVGSISYPVSGLVDAALDGQEVTVTGYLIGTNSGKVYANTMATSVTLADGSGVEYTPVGVAAYAEAGTEMTVRGVVAATYGRGFLVTDGSGYILYYNNAGSEIVVNDIVTVSGAVSAYGGFNQFTSAATVTKVADGSFSYPAARPMDAVSMEAYLSAPYVGYVTYEGVLTISDKYYNIAIDGSTNVTGSLSYAQGVDAALDGKRVTVTGYAIGTSSGKYFNTMVTSVVEAAAAETNSLRPLAVGSISASQPNASSLYVFNGSAWEQYQTDAASIVTLPPTVYTLYGSSTIASGAIDGVAATYLPQALPYAQDGDLAAVVYNSGSIDVKEYTFSNGAWAPTPQCEQMQYIFEHKEDGWSADMSTYLNETFLGSTGGFEIQNVSLGSLTYVWRVQSAYGWTASAYASGSNHATESWIVSPRLNFTRATAPAMQMDVAVNYLSGGPLADICNILISTDYTGDVTTATWTTLTATGWPESDSWTFYTLNPIDLSAFTGERVNVAFRYTSSDEYAPTWEIKNLIIAEAGSMAGTGEETAQ